MALFVANDTLVKLAAAELAAHQILLIRGLFGVCLAGAYLVFTGDIRRIGALRNPIALLRCLIEALVALSFITALAVLPISDITAILLISPLVITLIGAIVLKEDVRWRRWAAVIVGFVGMALVVKPGGGGFQSATLLAVASAIGVALRDLVTRRIPRDIPSSVVAAGTLATTMLMGGAITMTQPWVTPGQDTLVYLAGAALMVALGNLTIILAFRDSEVSAISPFRYTVIVWAVISGALVFGNFPSRSAWVGIFLIVSSGLYTLYRETIAAHRQ